MSLFVVDVEADGPAPGLYSMVSFGVVLVDTTLVTTFYGETAPITGSFIPEALAVSNVSRAQHLAFEDPAIVIPRFVKWVNANNAANRPTFVSDNPAFDWQFINYYCHRYAGTNPFGHSARRIGDYAAGVMGNWSDQTSWKKLRKTRHTHNPVDDAMGNVEALLALFAKSGTKIPR